VAQEEFLDEPMADVIDQWRFYFSVLNTQTGDIILDVGCNTGDAERLLLREYPPIGKVIGVENDPKRYEYALSKWREDGSPSQIELRTGDALALPFPDAHFDRAFCVDTLEWVKEPPKALQEIHRVLNLLARPSSFIPISTLRCFNARTKNFVAGLFMPIPTADPTVNWDAIYIAFVKLSSFRSFVHWCIR
jgi:ubiquinone/menaquinone biosynthesis C-methylase UbiE